MQTPSRPFFSRAWSRPLIVVIALLALLVSGLVAGARDDAAVRAPGVAGGASAVIGDPKADADPSDTLERARQQIDAIQKQLRGDVDDDALARMRADAQAISARAEQIASELGPSLASVNERLAELGAAPAAPGQTEAADLAEQRAMLTKRRDALDAQQKLSRLLVVEADQVSANIAVERKARFQRALGERSATPLAGPFWHELSRAYGRDRYRVAALFDELRTAASRTPAWVWAVAAAVIAFAWALRRWIDRLLLAISSTRVPPGRLRRSAFALGEALTGAIVPGAVAYAVYVALTWTASLHAPTDELMGVVIGAMVFGGLVAGIGHALLMPERPSWRLLPLPDAICARARPFVRVLSVWLVLLTIVDKVSSSVNATLEASVAVECLFSLVLIVTLAIGQVRIERERRRLATGDADAPVPARPLWMVVLTTTTWVIVGASAASLAIGYLALGSFLVRQFAWVLIVAGITYLITVFLNDLLMSVLAREGRPDPSPADASARAAAAETSSSRRQAAVLASGLMRIVLCVIAVALVMAPFGEGPVELMQRADRLRDGLSVGELQLRPLALLRAGAVLVLGLMAVRGLRRWMLERYLPTTRIEQGMHSSVATLLGYVCAVVVVAVALSELGMSLERVAWMASALSVGIGFGLQAVVQNFVSGLILLAERPVKVGDWVSLGGAEGDIRRINVRATEIQLGDRSTVIVPNSEFITKTVRNVTRADPLGLVQFKFPMPLTSDAERVRDVALAALAAHKDVRDEPAPKVFLDGIEGGHLIFNASASVGSPRQAYGVKSAILFDLLARLREAGLPLASERAMVVREETRPDRDGGATPR
ncbi:MAG: DUF3772 domain-containing protein [Burkholderiaceae bacterium]